MSDLSRDHQPKEPRPSLRQVLAFITSADCEELRAIEWWLNESKKHQPQPTKRRSYMTWIFNLKSPELISIVEHTKAHQDECLQAYSKDKADPSLFLVKDSGCYLMPATKTLLPREEGKPASVVAYAEGARPEDGHIGGDDYAENIPLGWFVSPAAVRSAFIVITVTSTNLSAKYTQ